MTDDNWILCTVEYCTVLRLAKSISRLIPRFCATTISIYARISFSRNFVEWIIDKKAGTPKQNVGRLQKMLNSNKYVNSKAWNIFWREENLFACSSVEICRVANRKNTITKKWAPWKQRIRTRESGSNHGPWVYVGIINNGLNFSSHLALLPSLSCNTILQQWSVTMLVKQDLRYILVLNVAIATSKNQTVAKMVS